MKTKTPKHAQVEFFATPRLALAYRSAAKRNKFLARRAGMHEIGHTALAHKLSVKHRAAEIVVICHADEDQALSDERLEDVVGEGFHLVFTEPSTHPDQIAHWMRRMNIRSEDRLHVVKVEDLEAPRVAQLLGRVCSALGRDSSRGIIIDAYLSGDTLHVRGSKHRMLHVPVGSIPSLRDQAAAVVRNFTIDPDGSFLYWPELDAHIGWDQFLQMAHPEELRKAQQRSAAFNRRYGAAIRKVREEAGIPQSKIKGLTERQVRRIEQGECRATAGAVTALAKAHGLDGNAYMERVARAMT